MLKSKRQNLHDTSNLKFFEWVQIGIAVIQSNLNQKQRCHVIKKNWKPKIYHTGRHKMPPFATAKSWISCDVHLSSTYHKTSSNQRCFLIKVIQKWTSICSFILLEKKVKKNPHRESLGDTMSLYVLLKITFKSASHDSDNFNQNIPEASQQCALLFQDGVSQELLPKAT